MALIKPRQLQITVANYCKVVHTRIMTNEYYTEELQQESEDYTDLEDVKKVNWDSKEF